MINSFFNKIIHVKWFKDEEKKRLGYMKRKNHFSFFFNSLTNKNTVNTVAPKASKNK